MWIAERLISLIAPHSCRQCGLEGAVLCQSCAMLLQGVPSRCYRCHHVTENFRTCAHCCKKSKLYAVHVSARYAGVAKDLIYALKFERAQAAAKDMAWAIAARYQPDPEMIITHIPTATARVRLRGYDQAALIAQELSRLTAIPYTPLLARKNSGRQVGQKRAGRQAQMQDAFRPLHPTILERRHILLVDDVLTTGATCEAAARTLKGTGARRVSAVVFAVA